MNLKLSPNSQKIANILLKHYPIQSSSHSQEKLQHQHMHDYRKQRQIFEKPTLEKLQNMSFLKEEGNNHYKNQRYNQAIYFYQKVIIYGDYTFPDNEADTAKMDALLQQTNCNMALSLIKLDKWQEVKIYLNQAIRGSNVQIKCKGLYWLSKYYIRNKQYKEGNQMIKKLKGYYKQEQVKELENEILKLQDNLNKQIFKNVLNL